MPPTYSQQLSGLDADIARFREQAEQVETGAERVAMCRHIAEARATREAFKSVFARQLERERDGLPGDPEPEREEPLAGIPVQDPAPDRSAQRKPRTMVWSQ